MSSGLSGSIILPADMHFMRFRSAMSKDSATIACNSLPNAFKEHFTSIIFCVPCRLLMRRTLNVARPIEKIEKLFSIKTGLKL